MSNEPTMYLVPYVCSRGGSNKYIYTNTPLDMYPSNVTITRWRGRMVVNMRMLNYTISYYTHSHIECNHGYTENYIGVLSDSTIQDTTIHDTTIHDTTIHDTTIHDTTIHDTTIHGHVIQRTYSSNRYGSFGDAVFSGREDIRLVVWNDRLYGICSRPDVEDHIVMELLEFDEEFNVYHICYIDTGANEKNWMPISDKPFHFMYSCNTSRVIRVMLDGSFEFVNEREVQCEWLSGSTQLINYKNGYIGVVHRAHNMRYESQFVKFDKNYNIEQRSVWYRFSNPSVERFERIIGEPGREFCCGMSRDDSNIYVTYSIMDTSPQLLTIPVSVVDDLFEERSYEEITEIPTNSSNRPNNKLDLHTEYSHTLFLLQQNVIDERECINRMIDLDHKIYPVYKSRPYDY